MLMARRLSSLPPQEGDQYDRSKALCHTRGRREASRHDDARPLVTVGGPGTCAFFPRNVPHAWKSTGSETGRVLFLYTPAAAGGYVEALS